MPAVARQPAGFFLDAGRRTPEERLQNFRYLRSKYRFISGNYSKLTARGSEL